MSYATLKLVLSISLLLSSALAQDDRQRYTLSFTIENPVEQCGETAIGYTLTPALSSLLPVELSIGVQDTNTSNYFPLTATAELGNFTWTWNPVNMTAGQYRILAADSANTYNIHGISSPFSIQAFQGGSTACLTSTGGDSGGNSSASITSTPSSETASPSLSSTDPSSANTSLPTTSSGSHLSTGLKAGLGVAGALILIAGLGAVYWFLVARRRSSPYPSPSPKGNGPFGDDAAVNSSTTASAGRAGRWSGLASVDDHEGKLQTTPGYGYGAAAAERSFGSISANNVSHSSVGPGASVDLLEKNGYGGYPPVSPAADIGDGAAYDGVAYLPPVTMYDRRSPTNGLTSPMARTTSASSSQSRRSVHGSAYPPSVPEDVVLGGGTVTSPNTPTAPTMGLGLGLVAGDVARRSKGATARKPVPSYTGEEDENQQHQSPTTPSSTPDPNRSSYIDPFASRQSSVSSSSEHLQVHPSPALERELNHKSSFGEGTGGKPMQHVLIPDLPAPQRVSSPPIRM